MLPVDRDINIDVKRPYCEDFKLDLVIPTGERDGYVIPAARLRRAEVANEDVPVVAGLRDGGKAAPQAKEIMTASGDKQEGGQ